MGRHSKKRPEQSHIIPFPASQRRRHRQRKAPRRTEKTSLLSSFKKIVIPAALLGTFVGLAMSPSVSISDIIAELRQKNAENSTDTISRDSAAIPTARLNGMPDVMCRNPRVTDGDTLRCGDIRIRLQGIDSPEMGGKCRPGRECVDGDPIAAKANLQRLVARGPLECTQSDTDRYGRMVARCVVAKVDLSCEQIRTGHAVPRYARIDC
jgi:endonuclease YncB( thermonuclease family)